MEIGFELYDTFSRIHERYFTKDGYKTMPFKVFVLALFHHCLSFSMIIPCNLTLDGQLVYPKVIYSLSIGAGSALLIRQYCTMLDVNTS